MEKSLGGSLPRFPSIDKMVETMDDANVEQVFVTQTKMWSYRNKWMYLSKEAVHFMNSRMGRDRVVWGTNGLDWKKSLAQLSDLGLKDGTIEQVTRTNAIELFGL